MIGLGDVIQTDLTFDGFFAWTLPGGDGVWGNGSKTISVEEMAVITATGAEYLVPPQHLILIRAK